MFTFFKRIWAAVDTGGRISDISSVVKFIWFTPFAGGTVMSFFLKAVPWYTWIVLAFVVAAAASAIRYFWRKDRRERETKSYRNISIEQERQDLRIEADRELRYLSDKDSELGSAIYLMATFSAWAKWFSAQHLALNEHKPISESSMLRTTSSLVLDAAMNGKLSMRGRPHDSIHYESISRETWRLIAISMEPHPASLWKATIITRSGVEPGRVQKVLDYDSIILDSWEFEELWPRDDKRLDRARIKELRKAKRLGANIQAIEKLAKGNTAI